MVPDTLVFLLDEEALIREIALSKIQITVEAEMHRQSENYDVLISAAIAARDARDRELENALQDPSVVELFKFILDHAFLLPLMELKLNQCTSFNGGQILTQQDLARPFLFSSESPLLFGKTFISLEITAIGENEFREIFRELPSGRHLAFFEKMLTAYSCIDFGTGVCGTQPFIEQAILSSDHSLIERIVDAETGEAHFSAMEIEMAMGGSIFKRDPNRQISIRGAVVDLKNKILI